MNSAISWTRVSDSSRQIIVQVDSNLLPFLGTEVAIQIALTARQAQLEWFVDRALPLEGIPITARGLDLFCFKLALEQPSVEVFFITARADGEALFDFCCQAARVAPIARDPWYLSLQ